MERVALEVVWSGKAIEQRSNILLYWKRRLGSAHVSEKLAVAFDYCFERVAKYPGSGRPVRGGLARVVIVRRYALVYRVTDTTVRVLEVWDTRRNPAHRPY